MSTEELAAEAVPLYARLLRLRRLKISGLASFVLVECTIAVGILLALAELVSWWAVPVLPALVATVMKINDMVGAPVSSAGAGGSARHSASTEHQGFFPVNRPHAGSTANGTRGASGRQQPEWPAEVPPRGNWSDQPTDRVAGERRARQRTDDYGGHYDAPTGRQYAPGSESGRHAAMPPPERSTNGAGGTGAAAQARHESGGAAQPPQLLNVPGAQAPARARMIGAAVRRSMAMQGQFGTGVAGSSSGAATRSSGRHARQDSETTGRRSRTNERRFDRSA